MKSRDELQNDYEEALFAIIMDDIMELEGRALLEERIRLSESDEFRVPDDMNERCIALIDRLFKERNIKNRVSGVRKVGKIILIAAIVMSLCLSTAYASVPTVRAFTMNVISDMGNKIAKFALDDAGINNDVIECCFEYIPNGFSIVDQAHDEFISWYVYQSDSKRIYVSVVYNIYDYAYEIDLEDCVYEEVVINGFNGLIVERNKEVQIVLRDDENGVYLDVLGLDVDKDLIIKMIQNIKLGKDVAY